MRIAFFDLDNTLLSCNSATLWIRFELAAGRIKWGQGLRALAWILRYQLLGGDMRDPIRRSIATLCGRPEEEMRTRARIFYNDMIRHIYRPGAFTALRQHREEGDRLVLLTSSSNYVAEHVSRDLALDDFVSNRFEVDASGCYTGRAVEPLCFGEGKVFLAQRYAEARGCRLADSAFYTDSHSDLPMLEMVAQPVAVHPDPRLRRVARRRRWPMVDWGSAPSPAASRDGSNGREPGNSPDRATP